MTICKLLIIPQSWFKEPANKKFTKAFPAHTITDPCLAVSADVSIASVTVPISTYGGMAILITLNVSGNSRLSYKSYMGP